jgi:hypothetical protein
MSIQLFLRAAAAVAALTLLPTGYASAEELSEALAPQALADALDAFARDTGFEVVYRAELTRKIVTRGAPAGLSPEDTLRELLRETGLTYVFLNEKTVAIRGMNATDETKTSATQPANVHLPRTYTLPKRSPAIRLTCHRSRTKACSSMRWW